MGRHVTEGKKLKINTISWALQDEEISSSGGGGCSEGLSRQKIPHWQSHRDMKVSDMFGEWPGSLCVGIQGT